MNPNSTSNVQITQQDQETVSFLNSLVMAMLGYSILDIDEDKRADIISQCVEAFTEYLVKFTEIKYGKTEAIRLKASQTFNDPNMFSKFKELGGVFEDAFSSFLKFLDKRWDKKGQQLQAKI